jgi:hypothetical protein
MRQWVDTDRTILVVGATSTIGTMTVATRPDSDATWGPPVTVRLEPDPRCSFCHGEPVTDAAGWTGVAACPRCGGIVT